MVEEEEEELFGGHLDHGAMDVFGVSSIGDKYRASRKERAGKEEKEEEDEKEEGKLGQVDGGLDSSSEEDTLVMDVEAEPRRCSPRRSSRCTASSTPPPPPLLLSSSSPHFLLHSSLHLICPQEARWRHRR